MVFPVPGGPVRSTLWQPAAAISSARFTQSLTANVSEVACIGRRVRDEAGRLRHRVLGPFAVESGHCRAERRDRQHAQPSHHLCFACIGRRQQNGGHALTPRRRRDRESSAHRMNGAIERELAQQHDIRDFPARNHAGCRQNAERDRQVERRARLPEICRRQVDRDPMRREIRTRNCGWRS